MYRTDTINQKNMIVFKKIKVMLCAFTLFTFAFTGIAFSQKYKTAADTLKLNKEYSEVALDISKLNVQLADAKNKTAGYASKSSYTAQNATNSAQESKTDAATATNGNLGDAKTAMKQAKKANNEAKGAKSAKDDENDNTKEIDKLNAKIHEKQQYWLISTGKGRQLMRYQLLARTKIFKTHIFKQAASPGAAFFIEPANYLPCSFSPLQMFQLAYKTICISKIAPNATSVFKMDYLFNYPLFA